MPIIEERCAEPCDDVLSRIVTGAVDGRPLIGDEILGFIQLLFPNGVAAPWLRDRPVPPPVANVPAPIPRGPTSPISSAGSSSPILVCVAPRAPSALVRGQEGGSVTELLCYLRDGACCTLLLVRAPAREVAEALGRAVSPGEGTLGLACEMKSSDWTRVELNPHADLGLQHQALEGYEAILLLREGVPVVSGRVPDSPPCFETPVSTAASLSERLQTEAIAVWASDQGPGIGGLAEFANGRPTSVISTLEPAKLEALLERHLADDDEDAEEGEQFKDEQRHYLWPQESSADGHFDEAADARLVALGLDLESLGEPLWALTEGEEAHESLGVCLGIA